MPSDTREHARPNMLSSGIAGGDGARFNFGLLKTFDALARLSQGLILGREHTTMPFYNLQVRVVWFGG